MKVRANGKILLTGEYAVMDGALALALPTKLGQIFEIKTGRGSDIKWKSLDSNGKTWFSCTLSLFDFSCIKSTNQEMALRLGQLLESACKLNSDFLSSWKGVSITSQLEFDQNWGLGSSSTLIYFVAQWADVDPYDLLARTIGGSGYDIACCDKHSPILYQKLNGLPEVQSAGFNPIFKENLFFVYLNKKESTSEGIKNYKQLGDAPQSVIDELSDITQKIIKVKRFTHFEKLLDRHESIIANIIDKPRVQSSLFRGYWGKIKSLGAWGGDFVLVTSDRSADDTKRYFDDKGFQTIFKYDDLILSDN